jgi:hypothetical protein
MTIPNTPRARIRSVGRRCDVTEEDVVRRYPDGPRKQEVLTWLNELSE